MLKQNRTKELGGELRDQFGATLKELVEQERQDCDTGFRFRRRLVLYPLQADAPGSLCRRGHL